MVYIVPNQGPDFDRGWNPGEDHPPLGRWPGTHHISNGLTIPKEQLEVIKKTYPPVTPKVTSDGGSSDYYKLPEHASELRHLISHKNMSKSRGDIFKACYRLGEKQGADILYDLKKIAFFAQDLIEMHERGERI